MRVLEGVCFLPLVFSVALQALADENVRWAEGVDSLNAKRRLLVGDVLLASAFISYIGPFTSTYRKELLEQQWVPYLRKAFGAVSGGGAGAGAGAGAGVGAAAGAGVAAGAVAAAEPDAAASTPDADPAPAVGASATCCVSAMTRSCTEQTSRAKR